MEFRILGPVEVTGAGKTVSLAGRREAALLATLVLSAGEVVSTDRLIDALWHDHPPRSATKTLQNCVLRLRKTLGATVVETRPGGYRLVVSGDAIDAHRFERLIRLARTAAMNGTPARAAAALDEALGLWRGQPFSELAGWDPADGEAARLTELHRVAIEDFIDAELACGRHIAHVADIEAMVAAEPLRERRWAMLMLALYRCGQQADALRTYQRARIALAELGIEPGPELRDMEHAVIAQDESLGVPPAIAEDASMRSEVGRRTSVTTENVAVLFTDMVGSTALASSLAPDAADELRRGHFSILRQAVAEAGGTEVKNLGDGLMVVFASTSAALSCAVAMQQGIERDNRGREHSVGLRVGLSGGEVTPRGRRLLRRPGDRGRPTLRAAARAARSWRRTWCG